MPRHIGQGFLDDPVDRRFGLRRETFVHAMREPAGIFTYGGMIAHVLTFAAHTRTLVILTLKKAGIGDLLCWGDPMEWLAKQWLAESA